MPKNRSSANQVPELSAPGHAIIQASVAAPENFIQRPGAAAGGGEIQEHEAVEHRGFAAVRQWIQAVGRMCHEIREGHLAGEDEGHWPGEQAENISVLPPISSTPARPKSENNGT